MTDETPTDVFLPVDPASAPVPGSEAALSAWAPAAPLPSPADPTQTAAPPRKRRQRRRAPIWWITIGLLALFVLVGLGSFAYYAYLTFRPVSAPSPTSPWSSLVAADILPGPAVSLLAGANLDKTYRETMAVDAVETAAAQTIATAAVPEVQRLGWLTVLARRYALRGDSSRATELYQLAADLAVLAPDLGDHQRADALLSVAGGWILLGRAELARTVLSQVELIAQSSSQMEPPVRRQLLEEAGRLYDGLGDVTAARRVRALPVEALAQQGTPSLDPLQEIQKLGPPDYPATIVNAEAARRAQAQAFSEGWLGREGEVAKGQTQALERALMDEDLVRSAFYDQKLADVTLAPLDRARVQWDQIQWLIVKNRVADDLFGVSLVPAWSSDRAGIRQSLKDAYGRMSDLMNQYMQTLGAEQQGQASFNYYRRILQAARIGLYPDADLVFLANAMNDALLRWQQAGNLVPIAVIDKDGSVHFKLLDASANRTAVPAQ